MPTRNRSLCFDLENRPLAYWYGDAATSQITAFGWKWSDEDDVMSLVLCADGRFEDQDGIRLPYKTAYECFTNELVTAGIVYGHNIRKHDLPMLQAGLLRLQMAPLPALRTTDTLRDIPKRKGLSASLESFASMYELGGSKLKVSIPDWEKANKLEDEGIKVARERVSSDVLLQEKLRAKLSELGILRAPRLWQP